jgi:hypothetical protein
MRGWQLLNDLMHKHKAWLALASWERLVFIRLVFWLAFAGLLLRCFAYQKVQLRLKKMTARRKKIAIPAGKQEFEYVQRCAQLSLVAARNGMFHASCLPRTLALRCLLARDGIPVDIQIGWLPGADPVQAHAWNQYHGQVLGQEDVSAFTVFGES